MRPKRKKGVETLKRRYGLLFVTPWMVGTALFFLVPVLQSILFSLSDVKLVPGGIDSQFIGFDHYRQYLERNVDYPKNVQTAFVQLLYSLPLIIVVSLLLALILNQKFRGRLFFRALFFLPVIIATGNVLLLLYSDTDMTVTSAMPESMSANMFSVQDIVGWLALPPRLAEIAQTVIGRIFDQIWASGIQIVLFIAGLQSIPSSLYEAGRVEGATKWEEFWFITFPMLSHVTVLVALFTMLESLTDMRNPVMKQVYSLLKAGHIDNSAAMMWFYFVVVGAFMGLTVGLFSWFAKKRWDA